MDDASEALLDAGYVVVGLAVLWFQRAQVLRRELARELPDLPDLARPLAGAARGAAGVVRSVLEGTCPTAPGSEQQGSGGRQAGPETPVHK